MAECAELADTSGKVWGGGIRCKCTAGASSFYLKPAVRFRGESKLEQLTPFPGPFMGRCHWEPFFVMWRTPSCISFRNLVPGDGFVPHWSGTHWRHSLVPRGRWCGDIPLPVTLHWEGGKACAHSSAGASQDCGSHLAITLQEYCRVIVKGAVLAGAAA